jgi:hypothetical protein
VTGKRDVPYFLVIMLRMMLSGTVLVKACKIALLSNLDRRIHNP